MSLLVADPRHLLVVDRAEDRIEALDRLVSQRRPDGSVAVRFGVDQGDRAAMEAAVVATFGDEPIDVVIDDASHRYAPTVVSLEVLLPRLRPGGELHIEDWHASYRYGLRMNARAAAADADGDNRHRVARSATAPARRRAWQPLHRLVCELALLARHRPDVIASVTIDDTWASVVRGPAPLDPLTFRLSDLTGSIAAVLDG